MSPSLLVLLTFHICPISPVIAYLPTDNKSLPIFFRSSKESKFNTSNTFWTPADINDTGNSVILGTSTLTWPNRFVRKLPFGSSLVGEYAIKSFTLPLSAISPI